MSPANNTVQEQPSTIKVLLEHRYVLIIVCLCALVFKKAPNVEICFNQQVSLILLLFYKVGN